jgi:hypothetical protein
LILGFAVPTLRSATPLEQHAVVALFIAGLAIRRDRERVRALLAREFCEHAANVWPDGVPAGVTPGPTLRLPKFNRPAQARND